MTNRPWRRSIAGVPAIGLSVVPKVTCPVCSPAYAALLSSLGVGFLASTRYLLPLTIIVLAIAVASLFVGAATGRGLAPFWTGVSAAGFILLGKFAFDSALLMYSGVGSLVIASVWNAIPRRTTTNSCAGCLPAEARSQDEG